MCFILFCFQLIPRTITLDHNGKQLLLWPIKEVETLRAKQVQLNKKQLKKGETIEVTGINVAQVFHRPMLYSRCRFDVGILTWTDIEKLMAGRCRGDLLL